MQVIKIILIAALSVQICLGMPMSASLAEGNINSELVEQPVEENTEMTLEEQQMQQSARGFENLSLENKHNVAIEPEDSSPQAVEQQQQQSYTMTKDFPVDMGKLTFENPTQMLSAMPDLQKLQRDQLFSLAMAQFMQYVQSIVRESETKLPNILKDFGNMKDMKFGNQMAAIEKYMQQLDDYKIETQQFATSTFAIPEKYENLLQNLKSKSKDNFEMQQILQNYDLGNYKQYIENYLQSLKKMAEYELNRISTDFTVFEKDSQDSLKAFYTNMLNQSELKNYVENLSNMFK